MSNQGNVIVRSQGREVILTTGRWGGPGTPHLVQRALAVEGEVDEVDVLYTLCHSSYISHPVFRIGNSDVPVVIVDMDAKTVTWKWDHSGEVIGTWTFVEYVDADLEPLLHPHFE